MIPEAMRKIYTDWNIGHYDVNVMQQCPYLNQILTYCKLDQNTTVLIPEDAFEMTSTKCRPFCSGLQMAKMGLGEFPVPYGS